MQENRILVPDFGKPGHDDVGKTGHDNVGKTGHDDVGKTGHDDADVDNDFDQKQELQRSDGDDAHIISDSVDDMGGWGSEYVQSEAQ